MTITTDKVNVPEGTDFTFVCKKIPFAISCLTEMPHRDANLVDLDLVNKMGITLRDIKVTRMSLLGHDVRAVGRIKQTIQCVSKGRVQGTIHLEAKVVRDLYTILGADCVASARTYSKLMGKKPPDPSDDNLEEEDTKQPLVTLGGVDDDDDEEEDKKEETQKKEEEVKKKARKKEKVMKKEKEEEDQEKKEDQDANALKTDHNTKDEENKAPFCDDHDQPETLSRQCEDHSIIPLDVCYAHEKWKLVSKTVQGIEISAFSNDYDVSSETAIHHAKAEHEYDMLWWEEEYDAPLEAVECNPEARKFCKTCFKAKKPESVWRSHHTGQMLACPSIPIEVKRDIVEKYKRGEE